MSYGRKIQPVSFSEKDPYEVELYKHAMRQGVFSKYVKRLIQRDMETKKAPAQPVKRQSMTQLNGLIL